MNIPLNRPADGRTIRTEAAPSADGTARVAEAAPRVLGLIPAFNPDPESLAATLASLLAQTVPIDICLIDDGSTPPVEVPGFASGRTRLVRLGTNQGITEALTAGVQFASEHGYEFICRLDVGDLSYPGRVERQLRHLDDHPEIDLVGAFSRVIAPNGDVLFHHGVHGGPAAVASYLRKNSPFRHSSFFIRTRPLVEKGGYSVAFDGAEDYELLLRLSDGGRVDCVPETLVDYIVDLEGISEVRRARQLRKRLAAQIVHLKPLEPACYAGILRTLAIMVTPRRIAQQASQRAWSRGAAQSIPAPRKSA